MDEPCREIDGDFLGREDRRLWRSVHARRRQWTDGEHAALVGARSGRRRIGALHRSTERQVAGQLDLDRPCRCLLDEREYVIVYLDQQAMYLVGVGDQE